MAFQREVAQRMFAQEYNAARVELKGEGEKDPSFLVTPLGAKVNRLHVVGVCTECEAVGESGDVWRARISDPTGIFTVYAGQFQPEAAQVLSELQPPQFVAVTGKSRLYEPEPGSAFVSIRPESVTVVDEATRDLWVLQTAEHTMERTEAVQRLRADPQGGPAALEAQGTRSAIAAGAALSQEHYGLLDVSGHVAGVRSTLAGLLPGGSFETHSVAATDAPAVPAYTGGKPTEVDAEADAFDDQVLAVLQRLEGDEGADWDAILQEVKADVVGADDEKVEESLNRLMDKGLVYEPTLGVLRST